MEQNPEVPEACSECLGSGKYDGSNCCGTPFYDETDICTKCKEHASDECDHCGGNGYEPQKQKL